MSLLNCLKPIPLNTYEILVPYTMGNHRNPDKPKKNRTIQVPYHQQFDQFVINLCGGLTICRVAKGQWVSPSGQLHKELMIPVRISCNPEQIEEIIKFTASHYEQEAVHCSLITNHTIIYQREI